MADDKKAIELIALYDHEKGKPEIVGCENCL